LLLCELVWDAVNYGGKLKREKLHLKQCSHFEMTNSFVIVFTKLYLLVTINTTIIDNFTKIVLLCLPYL